MKIHKVIENLVILAGAVGIIVLLYKVHVMLGGIVNWLPS